MAGEGEWCTGYRGVFEGVADVGRRGVCCPYILTSGMKDGVRCNTGSWGLHNNVYIIFWHKC